MLLELRGIAVHNLVSVFALHLLAIIGLIIVNNTNSFSSFVDYYSFNVTLGDPVFWFGVVLLMIAAIFPILAAQAYVFNYVSTPESDAIHREIQRCVSVWLSGCRGTRSHLLLMFTALVLCLSGGKRSCEGGCCKMTRNLDMAATPQAFHPHRRGSHQRHRRHCRRKHPHPRPLMTGVTKRPPCPRNPRLPAVNQLRCPLGSPSETVT